MTIEGKFIVIEGIDGAGTTTQSKLLVDWLLDKGIHAVWTSEPSNGPIGVLIRQILSGRMVVRTPDGAIQTFHNDVMALLFAADRMDHVCTRIDPVVRQQHVVVSDRYYHSSLAYQTLVGDPDWILKLNAHARIPAVTFILDVPADLAQERRSRAGRGMEEMYEDLTTQQKVRAAYLGLKELLPDQEIVVIDASGDIDSVHRIIADRLASEFGWI